MEKIRKEADLVAAILLLELKQEEERILMKNEFQQAYESMKPINLIKSTFKKISHSKELKGDLINTSVGIATGYVSKLLIQGAMHTPLRKLLGTVLMFGITRVVFKNPELVKSAAKGLFTVIKKVTTRKKREVDVNNSTEKV